MKRFFLFLAWPLAEIALFVVLGGEIGLWATLGWIFATGIFGMMLLRRTMAQGAIMMQQGSRGLSMKEGKPISGLFRAFAAVMLILPGFLTDFIGLLLLLPPVQMLLTAAVMKRVQVVGASMGQAMGAQTMGTQDVGGGFHSRAGSFGQDDVIDGDWVEVDPQRGSKAPPSRWVESKNQDDHKH